jgi:hypothetical protein
MGTEDRLWGAIGLSLIWIAVGRAAVSPLPVQDASQKQPLAPLVEALARLKGDAEQTQKEACILIQLQKATREQTVTADMARLLVEYFWRAKYDSLRYLTATILAKGDKDVEHLVVQELRSAMSSEDRRYALANLTVALALGEQPSQLATDEIVKMADSEKLVATRMFYVLALAARGDGSRDWLGQVARYVTSPAEEEEEALPYPVLMDTLCYVAPALERSPVLADALWSLSDWVGREGRRRYGGLCALVALPAVAPREATADRVRQLRSLLKRRLVPAERVCVHMAIARMSVEQRAAVQEAVRVVGSEFSRSEKLFLEDKAALLFDEGIMAAVGECLSARTASVRVGALRVAGSLGPAASAMLARVRVLRDDPNRDVSATAAEVAHAVAGVDSEGAWAEDMP